jgi:radical SAM superfamily enzyme YgiQ (UPF0313 family)
VHVHLVSAPTHSAAILSAADIADFYDAPLGILTLAAVLENKGWPVSVSDPDAWRGAYLQTGGSGEEWPEAFARSLARNGCPVYGFSTICSSFPTTLRIVRTLRALRPEARMIFGGPQASVVDEPILREFGYIDYVVRGEADETLPQLLDSIASGNRLLDFIPGIDFRLGREIRRTGPAAPLTNLDPLPLPAYHLLGKFRRISRAAIELGRGCPFACKFCSTNNFFRRKFRLKSPGAIIGQMRAMEARYGTRIFSMVHDMFTVDRRAVAEFCRAMIESGDSYRWSCSARTDCVDPELLTLMAEAGCRGIFFGIETGSARMQKIVDKNLDLDEARANVFASHKCSIATTVSLITGFPEECEADLRDTVGFIMDAARLDSSAPQLHLLAPLAGTPIERAFRGRLKLDRIGSDISGAALSTEELSWVEQYPEIFPDFYSVPSPHLDRAYLRDVRSFLLCGLDVIRWLLVALHQTAGHILDVYAEWVAYLKEGGHVSDFRSPDGIALFLTFSEERYDSKKAVAAFAAYYRALLSWPAVVEPVENFESEQPAAEGVPTIGRSAKLVKTRGSFRLLLDHLRGGTCDWFEDDSPGAIIVRRMSHSKGEVLDLPPLGVLILELCDGRRNCFEIAREVDRSGLANQIKAPALAVVTSACRQFQADGLVSFAGRRPLAWASQARFTSSSHEGAFSNRL